MAFLATVKGQAYLGPMFKVTFGDWSGASGDAPGTIVVSGPHVWGALFFQLDAASSQVFPSVSESVSGSVTTLTIQNQDDVTAGRFIIFHQA